jgi:hypothetical protein
LLKSLRSPLFALLLLMIVLLLIGIPLLSRGSPVPPVDDGRLIEFRSEKLGFRVSYPAAWQAFEDPRDVVGPGPTELHAVAFVPSPDSKALVLVYVQTLTTTQTLDEYANRQMLDLRANEAKAQFSDLKPLKVGDIDARSTSATVTSENPIRAVRLVCVLNGQRGYGLTYTGPSDGRYPTAFNAVVDSFAFLP